MNSYQNDAMLNSIMMSDWCQIYIYISFQCQNGVIITLKYAKYYDSSIQILQ